jgi:hypothetical protein
MRKRRILSMVSLCLVLAACGGGDDEQKPDATTTTVAQETTSTTAPTTTTVAPASADRPRLQQSVIIKTDLPEGWAELPALGQDANGNAYAADISACLGTPPDTQTRADTVRGSSFQNGNNIISSEANAFKSKDTLDKHYAAMADTQNFGCIGNAFKGMITDMAGIAAAMAKTDIAVTKISGIDSNSAQAALRVRVAVSAGSQNITLYADVLDVRQDRFETSVLLAYFGTPPPLDLEKSLMAAAKQRLTTSIN